MIVQIVAVLYIMEDHAIPHRRRWTFVPGAGDPNMTEQNALPAAGVTNPDIMEDHAFPGLNGAWKGRDRDESFSVFKMLLKRGIGSV